MVVAENEIDIIAAFKQGDVKALTFFFKLHFRPLVFFAESLLRDKQEAEDIVSEKFMRLWDKHAGFDSFYSIKAFLYISTRNACLDHLKYSQRRSAFKKDYSYWSDNKEEEILHFMYEAELIEELAKEIEVLPKNCRRIFELSFFDNLNPYEVALRLGLSVKTVRNQKAMAVQLLKTRFLKRNLLFSALIFSASANNLFGCTETSFSPKVFAEKSIDFFQAIKNLSRHEHFENSESGR